MYMNIYMCGIYLGSKNKMMARVYVLSSPEKAKDGTQLNNI